jgi:hypothetical protein
MGRITFPGQPGKKVFKIPSQQKKTGYGGTHLSSQLKIGESPSRLAWAKSCILSLKQPQQKWVGVMV